MQGNWTKNRNVHNSIDTSTVTFPHTTKSRLASNIPQLKTTNTEGINVPNNILLHYHKTVIRQVQIQIHYFRGTVQRFNATWLDTSSSNTRRLYCIKWTQYSIRPKQSTICNSCFPGPISHRCTMVDSNRGQQQSHTVECRPRDMQHCFVSWWQLSFFWNLHCTLKINMIQR